MTNIDSSLSLSTFESTPQSTVSNGKAKIKIPAAFSISSHIVLTCWLLDCFLYCALDMTLVSLFIISRNTMCITWKHFLRIIKAKFGKQLSLKPFLYIKNSEGNICNQSGRQWSKDIAKASEGEARGLSVVRGLLTAAERTKFSPNI